MMKVREKLLCSNRQTVAFFETKEQLDSLLKFKEKEKIKIILVAVTPEADYAAERLGLDHRTVEEFYSETELIERGMQNFKRLRAFCDCYDVLIQKFFADVPGADMVSSIYDFYYFKRIFDALLNRVVMIQGTLRALKPNAIACFNLQSWNPQSGLDWPTTGLTSFLAPYVAKTMGCQIIWLPRGLQHELSISRTKRRSIKEHTVLVLRRIGLEYRVLEALALVRRGSKNNRHLYNDTQRPVLIAGKGWDVDSIVEYWQTSDTGQVVNVDQIISTTVPESKLRYSGELVWKQVHRDSGVREFFIIDGIDMWPVVESTLRLYTLNNLPEAIKIVKEVLPIFKRLSPAVLLTVGVNGVLARAARESGVTVVSCQHGGLYGYSDFPIAEYLDLLNADVFLAYGPGTAQYLEQPSSESAIRPNDLRAQQVSVGSPALDCLVAVQKKQEVRKKNSTRTIMYVNTNFGGDYRYHSYHMYADIEYWRFQRELVLTCARFPDIRMIIKLYPSTRNLIYSPITDWLQNHPVPNCEVTEVPFTEVMDLADAYMIDVPSTTLLQALTTDKAVIVLADSSYLRFDLQAAMLLRKRAIVTETREQFLKEVANFLSRKDWSFPQPVNDEFLMEYGTYLNDGQSAKRAVNLLCELAQ